MQTPQIFGPQQGGHCSSYDRGGRWHRSSSGLGHGGAADGFQPGGGLLPETSRPSHRAGGDPVFLSGWPGDLSIRTCPELGGRDLDSRCCRGPCWILFRCGGRIASPACSQTQKDRQLPRRAKRNLQWQTWQNSLPLFPALLPL